MRRLGVIALLSLLVLGCQTTGRAVDTAADNVVRAARNAGRWLARPFPTAGEIDLRKLSECWDGSGEWAGFLICLVVRKGQPVEDAFELAVDEERQIRFLRRRGIDRLIRVDLEVPTAADVLRSPGVIQLLAEGPGLTVSDKPPATLRLRARSVR